MEQPQKTESFHRLVTREIGMFHRPFGEVAIWDGTESDNGNKKTALRRLW
jgi:hypothetical protein